MKLAYIISMTRSGSTVLSAMLDQCKGVVSPPESSFPQILGAITPEERSDPKMLAALYHGATFPPTQLSLSDAEACMHGNNEEILTSLGVAVAEKLGRDPADVKAVVWKSPKTVGMQSAPLDIRVNPLKASREDAQKALAVAGIEAKPTPMSPYGLRIDGPGSGDRGR